jgi:hypothetical protein
MLLPRSTAKVYTELISAVCAVETFTSANRLLAFSATVSAASQLLPAASVGCYAYSDDYTVTVQLPMAVLLSDVAHPQHAVLVRRALSSAQHSYKSSCSLLFALPQAHCALCVCDPHCIRLRRLSPLTTQLYDTAHCHCHCAALHYRLRRRSAC